MLRGIIVVVSDEDWIGLVDVWPLGARWAVPHVGLDSGIVEHWISQ